MFTSGESPYRQSIEPGYAGISRFIANHPNPWGWNPFPYCGLPTQFLYVPVVPYTVAALTWITHQPIDRVFRIVVLISISLSPAAVFLLTRYFTKCLKWPLLTAIAYTVLSPSYGLFTQVHNDRGIIELPWRLQLLVKYGEGPHNVGLAILPLAVIALWSAGQNHKFSRLFTAAVTLAIITLTNWVAALGLAFLFLTFALSAAGRPGFQMKRLFAAAGLAYLLACFWLTPTFIRTIAFNWPTDAAVQYQNTTITIGSFLIAIVAARLILHWFQIEFYRTFVTLTAFGFGWVVARYYLSGVDTVPESHRYVMEFELFLCLALSEWFRAAMQSGDRVKQFCAVTSAAIMLAMGFDAARQYVTQSAANWKPVQKESTAEYKVARWLADQKPTGRVLASGGLRYRLNSWFDIQQIGGTFESGLSNRKPVDQSLKIRHDEKTPVETLTAMGIEYIVVHGPQSSEFYKDYRHPHKWDGMLPEVHTEGDDHVYKVPFAGLATPLSSTWKGASDLELNGPAPGPVTVMVNYDAGWQAMQDGRPIEIKRDAFGFMTLAAAPSPQTRIEMHYGGTLEQKLMAGISALSWLLALGWLWRERAGNLSQSTPPSA